MSFVEVELKLVVKREDGKKILKVLNRALDQVFLEGTVIMRPSLVSNMAQDISRAELDDAEREAAANRADTLIKSEDPT